VCWLAYFEKDVYLWEEVVMVCSGYCAGVLLDEMLKTTKTVDGILTATGQLGYRFDTVLGPSYPMGTGGSFSGGKAAGE
jgi:hypothetical protein